MEYMKVSTSSEAPHITERVFLGCRKKNGGKPASCALATQPGQKSRKEAKKCLEKSEFMNFSLAVPMLRT